MLTGHRPAVRRRRSRKSRAARIAVPLAIPMALGLTLGIVMAVTGGNHTTINQAANTGFKGVLGGHRGVFGRGNDGSGFRGGESSRGGGGDLANPNNAQDAAGNAINPNQTAAEAAASMNCTLAVPANPLSAKGLATPYQLGDGCDEAANGATEGAFVEATILAPNGQVQVYDPVVVNAGTQPAVAPTPPTIARGSQVIISMGFNGNALVLTGRGSRQANCIDALGNSVINQTPQCNAANFYRMANAEIANGTLVVPPTGTGNDGQPCETSESFPLIDQDQSDNVDSAYLINATTGQVAQNNAANAANLQGFTTLANGSDSGALANFIDPALGCQPFTATNTTSGAGTSSSQALTALSARQNQPQTPALLPVNDPQLLVAGQFSIAKTNVYRAEVDQPLLARNTNVNQNAAMYCQEMVNLQTPALKLDAAMEQGTSPVPAIGNNLANFLAARESASFANLNCQNFALANPVTLTLDGNGVATAATFNVTQQTANANGGAAATASASASASASATAAATAPAATTPAAAATSPAAAVTTPAAAATTPAAAATDTAAAGGAGN